MNILINTVNTLAPVFFLIIIGLLLRRTGFISQTLVNELNKLVYWIALPALLFYKVASASYDFHTAGKTFLVVLVGTLASIIVAYIIAFLLKMPAASIGTFVQGSFRGNLLYIGLPIILYSFSGQPNAEQMENTAAIVLGFIVPLYNVFAVIILLSSRQKIDIRVFKQIFRSTFTNPFFIACVAGIIFSAASLKIPLTAARTVEAAGQMALPLALIAIGATLAATKAGPAGTFAFIASILKIAFTPLIGFAVALIIGLGHAEVKIALIYLACPTAVVSFVMAEQLNGTPRLAAEIVLLSTISSIISLAVVVAAF